jgi:pimeloyl-ACP methyl ester carboxylesterase
MLNRVLTDRLEVAYEETGRPVSYPIVLLHGFPDDVRAWHSVVPALVESGFRTIVPYLRGFGLTRFRSTSPNLSFVLGALVS